MHSVVWRSRYRRQCSGYSPHGHLPFAPLSVPEKKKRGGGAILNLASVQGHACQRGVAAYVGSKGAILSLTWALALDYADDGIRVNSISPGSICYTHAGAGGPHVLA
ncbi:MAG: SDR family oxidoreductase [Acidobacteriaceae bacterium]|nr:SDR family oxidoreductase [Acidobacteriaceae bacterium]